MTAQGLRIPGIPARLAGPAPLARLLHVHGRVQGVGFRPFVARSARACRLTGWVRNTAAGVAIHVEGRPEDVAEFVARLRRHAPPAAEIDAIRDEITEPHRDREFRVLDSDAAGETVAVAITPDLATCPECLAEFLDPSDRRFGYALSGCPACGPRFTTLTAIPFDRERTSLAIFPPCPACLKEYGSPSDRRFHAQNITCPACGPRLWLEGSGGRVEGPEALAEAGRWLRAGGDPGGEGDRRFPPGL